MAETVTSICGIAVDDLVLKIEEFHGYRSPGILIGSRMVETALHELGETPSRNIHLLKSLKNDQPVPTRACPDCGEFYPERFGNRCPVCRGDAHYR